MNAVMAVILAHSFYSHECCGDRDCRPVPCGDITRNSYGHFIWHRGVNDDVMFNKNSLRPSEDDHCHVCVNDNSPSYGICLYLPPRVS